MSINTASEALAQGHSVVFFAAGDGVKILMKDVISNLHTVTFHGGNTNNISKRAEKLLIDFSTNGGVIHVSEGSFITYGVNQNNSKDVLININNIPGIDPEVNQYGTGNALGLDYFTNPQTQSTLLGVTFNF